VDRVLLGQVHVVAAMIGRWIVTGGKGGPPLPVACVFGCMPGASPETKAAVQDLDPDEQYRLMERERLLAQDPTMLAFAAAQKMSRCSHARLCGFGGDKAKGIHARKQEHKHQINFGTLA
jgi:hypothetical protein